MTDALNIVIATLALIPPIINQYFIVKVVYYCYYFMSVVNKIKIVETQHRAVFA